MGSVLLFRVAVPQQFFPASERPELVVDLNLNENASFEQTKAVAQRMERLLAGDERIVSVTSYVGGGSPRFYLPLNVQTPDIALAELVVVTRDEEAREEVFARLQQLFASSFPEARGRVSRLENGPSVGQPIQYRVAARDLATAAPLAEKVAALLLADPNARSVTDDLGEPLKTMRIELDQDKVRALGLSTETVAQSLQAAIGLSLIHI